MTPSLTRVGTAGVPRGISAYDGAAGSPSQQLRNNRAQPFVAPGSMHAFVRAPSALAGSNGTIYSVGAHY